MHLLLRADAGPRLGTGHVMRSLALAQAWRKRFGKATLLGRCESEVMLRWVAAAGVDFRSLELVHPDPADLATTLIAMEELGAEWLILDGYHFDPGYQRAIRAAGHRFLMIDDMAQHDRYYADVILNQNIYAGELPYRREPDSIYLAGTSYALLRPEFLQWRRWRRRIHRTARQILVTLGGGDTGDVLAKVIEALESIEPASLEACVISGPAGAPAGAVPGYRETSSRIRILNATEDMPGLMARADLAVSAGGSTCWELAYMGLPNVILVLSSNQIGIADGLARAGVAVNLGWQDRIGPEEIRNCLVALARNPERRAQMSRRGRHLVDGRGAERVVEALTPPQQQAVVS